MGKGRPSIDVKVKVRTNYQYSMRRLATVLLTLAFLLPSSVGGWPMFAHDSNHTGHSDYYERSIGSKGPVLMWDYGDVNQASEEDDVCNPDSVPISDTFYCEEVFSWSTTIGDFSSNVVGNYDKNVSHIVYATVEYDGSNLTGFLVIREGSPVGDRGDSGNLMWRGSLGNITQYLNGFEDFEIAYGTPSLADFDQNGYLEVAIPTPDGVVKFFEPKIHYNSNNQTYSSEPSVWSSNQSYNTNLEIFRSNPAIFDIDSDSKPDIVVSGIDDDELHIMAIDGTSHSLIWDFKPICPDPDNPCDVTEVSSPVVLENEGNSNPTIFNSVIQNNQLSVYGIQETSNGISVLNNWAPHTVGYAYSPDDDASYHPMIPSVVLANMDSDSEMELIVAQPFAGDFEEDEDDEKNARLHLLDLDNSTSTGWSSPFILDGGDGDNDIDATPAIGDLDGDGELDIVVVSWVDEGAFTSEKSFVWALTPNKQLRWSEAFDSNSEEGNDDDEHSISSPIVAVINTADSLEDSNDDVFFCVTPTCYAIDGMGEYAGEASNSFEIWNVTLPNRFSDNRIFNSPSASDLDNDGILDLVIDAAILSADLVELEINPEDFTILDENGEEVSSALQHQNLSFSITVYNTGNSKAENVGIELRIDDPNEGDLITDSISMDINAGSFITLEDITWSPSITGSHDIWCVVVPNNNEEVRYDNNNASKPIDIRPEHGVELTNENNVQNTNSGESANFTIDVRNIGINQDSFTASLEPSNWSWSLNDESALNNLDGNETVQIILSITSESTTSIGNYSFNFTITSEGNNSQSDSLNLTVSINQTHGVTLEVLGSDERTVFPDTTVSYTVRLRNSGNYEDTFSLSSDNGDSQWEDPEIHSDGSQISEVTLNSDEHIDFDFIIQSPEDASRGDFKVFGIHTFSDGDSSVSATKDVTTRVGQLMALTLDLTEFAGSVASFDLQYADLAADNAAHSYRLCMDESDSNWPGWEYTLEYNGDPCVDNHYIYSGDIEDAWLNITIPDDESVWGTELTIVLDSYISGHEDTIYLNLEVRGLSGLWIKRTDETTGPIYINPGEDLPIGFKVYNYDDEDSEVRLDASSLPSDWEIYYNDGDDEWQKSLAANSNTFVEVHVVAPSDLESGFSTSLNLTASSTDNSNLDPVSLITEISSDQIFGLDLSAPFELEVLGNVNHSVLITISNTGNGNDTFDISFSGDWLDDFSDDVDFAANSSQDFEFVINSDMVGAGSTSFATLHIISERSENAGEIVEILRDIEITATGLTSESENASLYPDESVTFPLQAVALDPNHSSSSIIYLEVCGDAFYYEGFYRITNSEDESVYQSHDVTSDCVNTENLTFDDGVYTLILEDDYGDAWDDGSKVGSVTVYDSSNNNVLLFLDFPDCSDTFHSHDHSSCDSSNNNGYSVTDTFTINSSPDTNITFEFSGDIADWAIIADAEQTESGFTIPVTVGEQNNVSLVITVPEGTLSGVYSLTISSYDENDSTASSVDILISVLQLYDTSINVDNSTLEVEVGDTASYSIEIINDGNGDNILNYSLANLPDDWSYVLNPESKTLQPDESHLLSILVTPTEDALAATYNFSLIFEHGGSPISTPLSLTVLPFYNLEFTINQNSISAAAGENNKFDFIIRNLGNIKESVSLSVTPSDSGVGLNIYHAWSSDEIEPGDLLSDYVGITIVSDGAVVSDWAIHLLFTSSSTTYQETVTLTLVKTPDLRFYDEEITITPSNPKVDDIVTAKIRITADFDDVDQTITVIFRLNGEQIGIEYVNGLGDGYFALVDVNFKVEDDGLYNLQIEIDPENEINEGTDGESNNAILNSFTVVNEGNGFMPFLLVLGATLAIGGFMYYRSKSKYSGEYMPPTIETTNPILFPLVVSCQDCSSKVRVTRSGAFRCPNCKSVSQVNETGEVSKREKKPKTPEPKNSDTEPSQLEISTPSSPPISQPKTVSVGGSSTSTKSKKMEDLLGPAAEVPAPSKPAPISKAPSSEVPQTEEQPPSDTTPAEKKKKKPPKIDNFGPSIGGL